MTIAPNTQAVLLLTSHFSKSSGNSVKPLTPTEWGRFAAWLRDHDLTPQQLMSCHPRELMSGWTDPQITTGRLEALLNRGSALAIATEKWLRAGLWVIARSDTVYPSRLKKMLGTQSPAVFFGCGNQSLLDRGGLAVVGSRDVPDDDLQFARELGMEAASQGYSVVSGGARGVDQAAMLGALESEGTAVGVLADSLLRACLSRKYRSHLSANNLVLISPFHPEVGFHGGNAMQRNKYIYCLSDAAVVAHSGVKGGTWNGATENLKRGWVPLWVKPTADVAAGNAGLVDQGGRWVTKMVREVDIGKLFDCGDGASWKNRDILAATESEAGSRTSAQSGVPRQESVDVDASPYPDGQRTGSSDAGAGIDAEVRAESKSLGSASRDDVGSDGHREPSLSDAASSKPESSFYDLFLIKLAQACSSSSKTPSELTELFGLQKTQLNAWLKQAQAEQKVKKNIRPVRYEWVDAQQDSLFES